jgi:hypothetical protein
MFELFTKQIRRSHLRTLKMRILLFQAMERHGASGGGLKLPRIRDTSGRGGNFQ